MAQTDRYKSFLNQANEKGLIQEFDEEDLKLAEQYPEFGSSLLYLKERYKGSTTAEQKALAHEAANQLRQSYATRGSAGTLGASVSGAYTPSAETTALNAALGKIQGSTYDDWKQGGAYGELKTDYENRGQKAMSDTLAQISARTGGLASSYAGQTAQGSYNEYMQALDEAAYNRYQNELDRQINLYGLMRNAEETAYNRQRAADETAYSRYLDEINRQNTDRSFAWNQYLDLQSAEQQALENERWKQQYADGMAQQALENQRWEQQYADQRADAAADNALAWYKAQNQKKPAVSTSDIIKLYKEGLLEEDEAKQLLGIGSEELQSETNLSVIAQKLAQRLMADKTLSSSEKKAEFIRDAYLNGIITEEEGYYLMSLY